MSKELATKLWVSKVNDFQPRRHVTQLPELSKYHRSRSRPVYVLRYLFSHREEPRESSCSTETQTVRTTSESRGDAHPTCPFPRKVPQTRSRYRFISKSSKRGRKVSRSGLYMYQRVVPDPVTCSIHAMDVLSLSMSYDLIYLKCTQAKQTNKNQYQMAETSATRVKALKACKLTPCHSMHITRSHNSQPVERPYRIEVFFPETGR